MPQTLDKPLRVVNLSEDSAEIYIYGEIGESWYEGDGCVSARMFVAELAKIPDGVSLNVRINSPGGVISDGLAIYHQLKERGNVTCTIDGYACSAASMIACAGSKVCIPASGIMMIHNPIGMCWGGAEEMRTTATTLDVHRDACLAIYTAKTGKSAEEITAALDAETWMTGNEAIAFGICDELIDYAPESKVIEEKFAAKLKDRSKFTAIGWKFEKISAHTTAHDVFKSAIQSAAQETIQAAFPNVSPTQEPIEEEPQMTKEKEQETVEMIPKSEHEKTVAERDKLQGEFDALTSQMESFKAKATAEPEDLSERINLIRAVSPLLKSENPDFKEESLYALSPLEIKIVALTASGVDLEIDGKSDDYIAGHISGHFTAMQPKMTAATTETGSRLDGILATIRGSRTEASAQPESKGDTARQNRAQRIANNGKKKESN